MLTTQIRTHYLILQDGRQFPITHEQYINTREAKTMEKATSFFALKDADTGKILFDGELRAVKEFKEVSKNTSGVKNYYCGYGNKHGIHTSCDCKTKYGVWENLFREKAYELYGKFDMVTKMIGAKEVIQKHYHHVYMQDLSYQERNKIVELCS